MMAKPMKTLELHYPMIQFLIKADKPRGMLVEHEKNLFGETCGLLLLYNNSEDARFFHGFTGTITHS